MLKALPINVAWRRLLTDIIASGRKISPRGDPTLELDHQTIAVDATRAVITEPERYLSYKFMAAEALWIINGRDDLSYLLPYAPSYARFSDDGKTLAGAYGPRIWSQLSRTVELLCRDPDTRQAAISIWTPNPEPSKDTPCTIAIDFKIRGGELNAHVFMRSSDVWLGLPYDLASFSLLTVFVTWMLNRKGSKVIPGTLYLTASSSHLYVKNRAGVERVLASSVGDEAIAIPNDYPLNLLQSVLDGKKGWWEL